MSDHTHFVLQAAKTYLERNFEGFPSCSLDQLIQHALKALQASCVSAKGLSEMTAAFGVRGPEVACKATSFLTEMLAVHRFRHGRLPCRRRFLTVS